MVKKQKFDAALSARLAEIHTTYPLAWQALDALCLTLSPEESYWLKLVYAGLDCHDLPSVAPEVLLDYVHASLKAQKIIPYTALVPQDLFAAYVLPPRVNNEWLDGSRGWLLEALLPRITEKDLLSAALEVNYWCSEQAAYLPTDDRTISPMGMHRRAQGRCGEESTLLVSALRAVGIPARQCYAPYWAHCDDNHAWVEFWAPNGWHYMGACEPEWQADVGWFQSAASKAMLIRSRVPDFSRPEGYRVVNTTSHYGRTALLRVQVIASGAPVPNAQVRFQLVNYSRLQTLHTCLTDERGNVSVELGVGSLVVSTCLDGVLVEQLVDLQRNPLVILRKEDGFSPAREEASRFWQLIPPKEHIPHPPLRNETHLAKLRQCEAHHASRLSRFRAEPNPWLRKACGNKDEIRMFLSLPHYAQEDKILLLETLTEKDFCDCTCQTLESFLSAALPYKNKVPLKQWQQQILAPRVEWEPLLPIRPELNTMLKDISLDTPDAVLDWMEQNILPAEEYGLTDRRGNSASYIRCGRCPKSEWHITAVQICRAKGIPAALSSQTGKLTRNRPAPQAALTLIPAETVKEEEHFSLSRWNGQNYEPVFLQAGFLSDARTFHLEPGAYSLITARRQIDGSVSANLHRFLLKQDRMLPLTLAPDETRQKLISCPLPALSLTGLTQGAEHISQLSSESSSLLIFLQPGKEPTEHLLQELISCADDFSSIPIRFVADPQTLKNETLQASLKALSCCAVYSASEDARFAVQSAAGIGDARLPLAIALDHRQKIVYGCANYQINTAGTMKTILSLVPGSPC